MSAIFNVNFSAVSPQILQNRHVEQLFNDAGNKNNKPKEISDTAYLSNISKNLNDGGQGNLPYLPMDCSGSVDSVRSFILNHKLDAMEQQANQSKAISLALIS